MHIIRLLMAAASACALLASCAITNSGKYYDRDGPPIVGGGLRTLTAKTVTPKVEPPNKWANRPYTVMGKRYVPVTGDKPMTQVGTASWYGKQFHGKKTSIGEIYDMYEYTAAHPTMELPSYARVTNLKNGRSIIVRVNDRGPFLHGRIIDLSYAAATYLGYRKEGTARVRVERITRRDIAAGNIPGTSAGSGVGLVGAIVATVSKSNTDSNTRSGERAKATSSSTVKSESVQVQRSPSGSGSSSLTRDTEPITRSQTAATTSKASSAEKYEDSMGDLITHTQELREPTAVISLEVEDAVTANEDTTSTIESPKTTVHGTFKAIDSDARRQSNSHQDAISAILSEEEKIRAQADAQLPEIEKESDTSNRGSWCIQLGAYSMVENARAAAAHAEMMLSQENISPVTVVQSGNVYRVYAAQVATRDEAVSIARRISEKLGLKAIPTQR